jgi:hypothetical protein
MSDIPTLTVTFSRDTIDHTGLVLEASADGGENWRTVNVSFSSDGDGTITFTTGYIYEDELVRLSYASGNIVDAVTDGPLKPFSNESVTNNSTVTENPDPGTPEVTSTSTITLTTSQDPAYFDGFRVYVDADTNPVSEQIETDQTTVEITFGDLSPLPSLGLHTLIVKTYNALGESPANGTPAAFFMT